MEPLTIHELTAAYALDALEPDELRAYEAHLDHCDQCRAELAELQEAAGALAWGVTSAAPPARLRAAILEVVAEPAQVIPFARASRPARFAYAVAAVAACAVVGLGIWTATLEQALHRERQAKASAAGAAAILADPSRRVSLSGAAGLVALDGAGRGVLVVQRLPAAPAGKTYEAWVIPHAGRPKRAGLFSGGDGTTVVQLAEPIAAGDVVAATLERAGGATQPTTTPLLRARIPD